jgi:hypothetical protein
VELRDFESILIYFSEEEIEELQAAIDRRRSLVLEKSLSKRAEQSGDAAKCLEAVFSEIRSGEEPATSGQPSRSH